MANNNHFELTLDTLAPQGSISGLNRYEKENKDLIIDGGDATFKKVWFDQESNPTKESAGYLGAEWEAKDLAVRSAFAQPGEYYYHLVLMDDVNNESEIYTLGPCYFDNKAPEVSNVVIQDSRGNKNNTNEVTLSYSFNYNDTDCGVYRAVVSGDDIETINLELNAVAGEYAGELTFKEGTADGNKSIKVVVYDRAENASVEAVSNVILLDRTLDKPVLLIQDSEGNNLPEYINYHEIKANLTVNETNIVGYKIWEGEEPDEYVALTAGEYVDQTIDFTLSSGDGAKTVNAKIIDVAGNEAVAESKSVIIDSVVPVAKLESNKTIISKVSGFDQAILSFGDTADNEGGSGINYYEITRNGEKVASGQALPAQHVVEMDVLEDGIYKYQLKVVDKALNESVSEEVAIIMDKTAPELNITELNPWYTEKFNISVSYSDTNSLEDMVVWTSTVAADVTLPENPIHLNPIKDIALGNISWNLAESASNYMHVMLVDEVGNVSYAHKQFGYDSVSPVIKSAAFSKAAYPNAQALINISYEDATSGVVEMRVSGDITNDSATGEGKWESIVGARQVELTTGDGVKTILVEIRDAAGLTASKSITCELDTTFPAPKLTLYEADKISLKPAHSQLDSFSARLVIEGDDFEGGVQFKIYGDFNYESGKEAGISKDEAQLVEFVKGEGVEFMLLEGLYCTKADGVKNIYVHVVDNAGNAAELSAPATFVYDTTLPEVTLTFPEGEFFNRISKVQIERRNANGVMVGKFADMTKFVINPDSVIQAYKVVAYKDASAAAAGSANDDAIGVAGGSVNMAASGLNEKKEIEAIIRGADFEAALGGEGNDGAHIVVVYVQDLAGHWSVAAQF